MAGGSSTNTVDKQTSLKAGTVVQGVRNGNNRLKVLVTVGQRRYSTVSHTLTHSHTFLRHTHAFALTGTVKHTASRTHTRSQTLTYTLTNSHTPTLTHTFKHVREDMSTQTADPSSPCLWSPAFKCWQKTAIVRFLAVFVSLSRYRGNATNEAAAGSFHIILLNFVVL